MSFHTPHEPDAVVRAETADEVRAVVALCAKRRVPLTPRGAGTGIEGGAVPYLGGVVLDVTDLDSIEVRRDDMQAIVGAGVKKLDLAKRLAQHGLVFGPDPASNPSVGGMVSTGGSGLSTLRYGTSKENVLSLDVVTPDGALIRTRQRVRKSSTGYDLTQLYAGAEGTLGVITSLTLRVHPMPTCRAGALASFGSIGEAAAATLGLLRAQLATLVRCECLNADGIRATNKKFGTELVAAPTLFLEFQANEPAAALGDAARAAEVAAASRCLSWSLAENGAALDALWEARRGCYLAAISYRDDQGGQKGGGGGGGGSGRGKDKVYLSDTCVPLSRLADCISETEEDFLRCGMCPIMCCHIADGNFHCCIPYQPDEKEVMQGLEHRMISRAISMGGTVSGEHGVGVGKVRHIAEEHGEEKLKVMRALKTALDPHNLMNPGKLLELPGWHFPHIEANCHA